MKYPAAASRAAGLRAPV